MIGSTGAGAVALGELEGVLDAESEGDELGDGDADGDSEGDSDGDSLGESLGESLGVPAASGTSNSAQLISPNEVLVPPVILAVNRKFRLV